MLTPAAESLGFEFYGLEFVRAGKHSILRIYIDHPDGISVDHCADVSHQASAILDVEDPINTEYHLEVSSPGMDRPLFTAAHFAEVVEEVIECRLRMPLDNRRKFKGKVTAADAQNIVILVDGQDYTLAITNIEKANVVPTFE
jgi:ribosome maturation factor RimP